MFSELTLCLLFWRSVDIFLDRPHTSVRPLTDYSRTYSLFAILTVCGHFPWSTTYVCPSSDRLKPTYSLFAILTVCGHFPWSTMYVCPSSDRLQPYLLSVCYFDGLRIFPLIDHVCLSVHWQTTALLTLCFIFWRSVDISPDRPRTSVRPLTDYSRTYSLFAILTVCGHFPWSTTYVCPSSDRLQPYWQYIYISPICSDTVMLATTMDRFWLSIGHWPG